ncbi:hypothetical protein BCR32DRAFT_267083 [Anaeromyces robustus]|uniref:MATH domain-containing protein n=1 Tax=Anaeromyces robustus TaxID=1754192 RepID=A0A1Y1XBW0_9FUNG|nr:hypothetical protein BCR32DRAFT_267083 [Anaeromyces robustus]|eukprot:ORX83271.1 hypothetical protein BCR32DRAFT_267083 [Anaeromyces robustus]
MNSKEQFCNHLKSLIKEERELFEDVYWEKDIEIWNDLEKSKKINLEFNTNGFKWIIDIKQCDDTVCVGFSNNDNSNLFYIRYVLFFRHCNDYSKFIAKTFFKKQIGNNNDGYEFDNYFNKDDNNLVENGKVVCGIYICVYKTDKEEKYLNGLKNLIRDDDLQNMILYKDEYYEYQIEKWNNFQNDLLTKYIYPHFNACQVQFCKSKDKHHHNKSISIQLLDYTILEEHLSFWANIVFSFRNVNDVNCHKAKVITPDMTHFYDYNFYIKYNKFIKESELFSKKNDTNVSIIENNKTIIGLYIRLYKFDKNYLNSRNIYGNNIFSNLYCDDNYSKSLRIKSSKSAVNTNTESYILHINDSKQLNEINVAKKTRWTNILNKLYYYNYVILLIVIIYYYYYGY